jgi:hypothetical protein
LVEVIFNARRATGSLATRGGENEREKHESLFGRILNSLSSVY